MRIGQPKSTKNVKASSQHWDKSLARNMSVLALKVSEKSFEKLICGDFWFSFSGSRLPEALEKPINTQYKIEK